MTRHQPHAHSDLSAPTRDAHSSIVPSGWRAERAGVLTRLMRELRGTRRGTRGRPIVLCSSGDRELD